MNDTYTINYTDKNNIPLTVGESETIEVSDISLFGRIKEEYGEQLDTGMLNLLENFSCPEDPTSTDQYNSFPDLSKVSKNQLAAPTHGQFWFNSTRDSMYYWDSVKWNPICMRNDIAANWWIIYNGQQLPKPVSSITGKVFDFKDCIWSVSPSTLVGKTGYIMCTSDENAVVSMRYRLTDNDQIISGTANYLIVGIRGNNDWGTRYPPVDATPTPTPAPTLTRTPMATPMATPVATVTRTPATTPNTTPPVTPTATGTPMISPPNTPPITPAITPTVTPTISSSRPIPLNQIVLTDAFFASSTVIAGAATAAGLGFQANGNVGKTGLNTSGRNNWLAGGYNASDFELSFTADWLNDSQPHHTGWYETPAGANTLGPSGAWYNMGGGLVFSVGGQGNSVNVALLVVYTIRKVGGTETVSGSISLNGIAGTPV